MTQHYCTLDESGFVTAFYNDEMHADALPGEAVEITDEQWIELASNPGRRRLVGGEVELFDPPPAPVTVDDFRRAIQAHIDAAAQSRSYDSGVTCSSYLNSTNPAWAAQASTFVAWRDAVWAYAYAELAKVEGGERAQPSVADIINELPGMVWPA